MKKKSMSVREMRRLLGLGKTEAYWLVKKNYFDTVIIAGKMRVMIESFENWYANQFKYQKVDGTPPGEELKKSTLSVEELGNLLGMAEATAYELIAKGHFEVIEVLGKRRITKESFERWYSSQSFYRTVEDQEKDQDILSTGYTVPQVARMLGIHRNNIHYLASKGRFETFQVGRHKCVTKESFEHWYKSQSRYTLVADMDGLERR